MSELSIIVPTFNEVDNIFPLYEAIEKVLTEVDWEIVYVDDDSTDGTLSILNKICTEKPNVRRIHRIARRGLSSAGVEGFLSTTSPFLAIIDGDLQHDETKLIEMLSLIRTGDYDLILGSRYADDGGFGDWDETRIAASRFATKLSRLITRQPITDPMSGFFMLTRDAFNKSVRNLSLRGYKLLLDIVTSFPGEMRIKDVSFEFRSRIHGNSKLDNMVMMEFVFMIIEKFTHGFLPARFVLFSAVGTSGLLVHFSVLYLLLNIINIDFLYAQAGATLVAMTSNFFINNWLTYFDRRLRGLKLLKGLFTFYAVCSLGSIANVGAATFVFSQNYTWFVSGFAGALIGTVWNYAATSLITWRNK